MHILVVIIGFIVTLSVWWFRIKAVRGAAKDAASAVSAAKNLPRRLAFRHRAGQSGPDAADDPVELGAIIMVAVAAADGGVSESERDEAARQAEQLFGLGRKDAEALITHAGFAVSRTGARGPLVRTSVRKLKMSEGMTEEALFDLESALKEIVSANLVIAPEQRAALAEYRRVAGLAGSRGR